MEYKMEKSTFKKKEIVDIIVKIMDEDGLQNITVKDICEAANISVGTFYHYFKSKDQVVDEMYFLMDDFFLANKAVMMNHHGVGKQMIAFVEFFGNFVEEWGYYANLLILKNSLQTKMESSESNRQIYSILEEMIQRGVLNKEFKCKIEIQELSQMIFVIIRGHLLEWVKKGENYPVGKKMVNQATCFLNNLTTS